VVSTVHRLNQFFEYAAKRGYGESEQSDATEKNKFLLLTKDAISKERIHRPFDQWPKIATQLVASGEGLKLWGWNAH
jgi:hypothetical protein